MPSSRERAGSKAIDAHFVLLGTACSFGISEERVARGRTVVCIPRRSVHCLQAGKGCGSSQDLLKQTVGARPHLTPCGKDEGVEQEWRGAQRLSRSSRSSSVGHSRAVVWRGDRSLPTCQQGFKVLGIPFGHQDFISNFLRGKIASHQTLLDRIPAIPDVQCAWLLLSYCAAARANFN